MPRLVDYRELFASLEDIFIARNFERHMVIGDFNIDLLKRTPTTLQYELLLSSFGFDIRNNLVTRSSGNDGSIIDHVSSKFLIDSCFTITNDLSDHNGVMSHFFVGSNMSNEPQFFDSKFTNYERLDSQIIERLYYNASVVNMNVHEKLQYLVDCLVNCVDDCTSVVRKRFRDKRRNRPWFSDALKTLCEKKRRFLRRNRRSLHIESVRSTLTQLETIRESQSSLKRDYYVRRFQTTRTTKGTWDEMNRVLGRRRSAPVVKRLLSKDGNETLTHPVAIANHMNAYFTSIGSELAQTARQTGPNTVPPRDDPCHQTMFLTPVTPDEVYNLISNLDINKSCGIDAISNKLLKKCSYSMTYFISDCINQSFSQGVFPDCLKTAKVSPIFKGGSRDDVANYRPISVLPSLNKIFEQAISSRLFSFLDHTKFLNRSQFGFRGSSNTAIAVTELMNYIYGDMVINEP